MEEFGEGGLAHRPDTLRAALTLRHDDRLRLRATGSFRLASDYFRLFHEPLGAVWSRSATKRRPYGYGRDGLRTVPCTAA